MVPEMFNPATETWQESFSTYVCLPTSEEKTR